MNYLYYGNGYCNIEGSDIQGVQITFDGIIDIVDTTQDGAEIFISDTQVLIFSLSPNITLNELFTYTGEFKIKSVIVASTSGEKLDVYIKRVMDYSEMLDSNSEDLTVKSEDLNKTYVSGTKRQVTVINTPIIKNLHTSIQAGILYLENGNEYKGEFHIHKNNGMAMTGAIHDENSQELYTKTTRKNILRSTKINVKQKQNRSTTRKPGRGSGYS